MTLKERRKSRGLTLKELAKLADVSYVSIFHYENGNYKPKYEVAKKLADVFGCTVGEIIAGFDEK